jgi:hypothetical protein
VPEGIRAAAHERRSRPARSTPPAVVVRQDWWHRPALAAGAAAVVLFAVATSEAGQDVVPWRIAVAVAATGCVAALGWLAVRARPVVAAHRTRRAAVEARLNELAAQVLHPAPATSPAAAADQAAQARRYVLLLHSYATAPLAEVERLLGDR